jgi:hypothetical protein
MGLGIERISYGFVVAGVQPAFCMSIFMSRRLRSLRAAVISYDTRDAALLGSGRFTVC